ncbi:Rrf2 family transcriptional regulator [Paenibacillus sp. CCS19]|uniref:Rrf2 family transcriptional regulator n=1 Tax=Paenibacillus sp. CCS19 TaxID=3158387 RepID=UPI0025678442|nr:Rrf2 family transcriptional regulator [Paenibacillus cellulosilyticus]GMK38052.1 Rrf2 family transcriptional regulator [Paenibacillus cellulosilyticus]
MISSKFSVAVHILSLIDVHDGKITSERIAGSVNTNAVVIRRIMSLLGKAGIIESRPGVTGIKLVRPLTEITLYDVYRAVELPENDILFTVHQNTNIKCMVGRHIQSAIMPPLLDAQRELEQSLAKTSVAEVTNTIVSQDDDQQD